MLSVEQRESLEASGSRRNATTSYFVLGLNDLLNALVHLEHGLGLVDAEAHLVGEVVDAAGAWFGVLAVLAAHFQLVLVAELRVYVLG